MIWCTIGWHIGEEVIANTKLVGIGIVVWQVILVILYASSRQELVHSPAVDSRKRSRARMVVVSFQGIACVWLHSPIDARKSPKQVIEAVVLHHNHDDMFNM